VKGLVVARRRLVPVGTVVRGDERAVGVRVQPVVVALRRPDRPYATKSAR
jgi:hypothetical protein